MAKQDRQPARTIAPATETAESGAVATVEATEQQTTASATIEQTTEQTNGLAAGLTVGGDDDEQQAEWTPPQRVRVGLGDGAIFEPKKPGGQWSVRVGVIEYELSRSMRVPFAVYRRTSDPKKPGGKLSLGLAANVTLVGIEKNDPRVADWLAAETVMWLAWFKAHGCKLPVTKAVAKGFGGLELGADDGM